MNRQDPLHLYGVTAHLVAVLDRLAAEATGRTYDDLAELHSQAVDLHRFFDQLVDDAIESEVLR